MTAAIVNKMKQQKMTTKRKVQKMHQQNKMQVSNSYKVCLARVLSGFVRTGTSRRQQGSKC